MNWLRRSRLMFITNDLGAANTYAIGRVTPHQGRLWRITRHRTTYTTPWSSIRVYGKPLR